MKKTFIALAALSFAALASAQSYVEGAIGQGNSNYNCGTVACTKTNTGEKLVVGYGVGGGLSYEGQYIDYGKISGATFSDVKTNAFGVNVAYSGVIADKLGYRVAGGLGRVFVKNTAVGGTETASWQPQIGAGVSYSLTPVVAATLDYDWSNSKATPAVGNSITSSVSLVSLGLKFKF